MVWQPIHCDETHLETEVVRYHELCKCILVSNYSEILIKCSG
jgi:hypothetical protein